MELDVTTILVAAGSALVGALGLALRVGRTQEKITTSVESLHAKAEVITERLDENEMRLNDLNIDRVRRDERWTHLEARLSEMQKDVRESFLEIRASLKELTRRSE